LNKLVIDTLKPLNVPVSFQTYSGNKFPHITFFGYAENGECWADNKEIQTSYYIQIDVWSKDDYISLVNECMRLMTAAGFKRLSAMDLYEDELKIYHKAIRFSFSEEIGGV
jgi:hypothetical protein